MNIKNQPVSEPTRFWGARRGAAQLLVDQALGVARGAGAVDVLAALYLLTATLVGYQTNTTVYNAGGHRFSDFLWVGIPLNLIFCALAAYFIPKFWPF